MLSVKNELLATLATALDAISPGAGAKAAFESPKVAAHGDFACTAAMQLAKPLKLNPRALGEQLKATVQLPASQLPAGLAVGDDVIVTPRPVAALAC